MSSRKGVFLAYEASISAANGSSSIIAQVIVVVWLFGCLFVCLFGCLVWGLSCFMVSGCVGAVVETTAHEDGGMDCW